MENSDCDESVGVRETRPAAVIRCSLDASQKQPFVNIAANLAFQFGGAGELLNPISG
jgi:hypothetical protein